MKKLNSAVDKKYAYVKSGVVFNIMSYDNGDSCVVEMTKDNIDSIKVNDKDLYLDNYVECGDKYSGSKFEKLIHNKDSDKETYKSLQEYYKLDCENEIAKTLIGRYYDDYEFFSEHLDLLGVPTYMIKQAGDTVVPSTLQIDFTEEYYDKVKKEDVEKLVLQAAKDTAEHYGYEVTTESIDIKKKGEEETNENVTDDNGGE